MALKSTLDTLEGLPEALHEHYKQVDGKFILEAEGYVPKTKLDEFRNNNINLLKEKDEISAKLEGIDIEEYKALKTEAQKNKEKKLISEDKIEEVVTERVTTMKVKFEKERDEAVAKSVASQARLEKLLIDNELSAGAIKSGCVDTALDDIISRGRQIFNLEDEKVIPKQGDKVLYGADGVTPLSITEWLSKLTETAPHLFKESKGGGAENNKGGGSVIAAKKSDLTDFSKKKAFIKEHGQDAYLNLPA